MEAETSTIRCHQAIDEEGMKIPGSGLQERDVVRLLRNFNTEKVSVAGCGWTRLFWNQSTVNKKANGSTISVACTVVGSGSSQQ